jgi:hypothetical protein
MRRADGGTQSARRNSTSPGCSSYRAATVVQADAQNVVGDVRAVIAGEQAAAATGDRRDEGARDVAEIDIEVFELGGSVAADNALDTGADGPPDTRCGAACRSR